MERSVLHVPLLTSLALAEKAYIDQSFARYSGRPGALLGILEAALLVEPRSSDGPLLDELRSN